MRKKSNLDGEMVLMVDLPQPGDGARPVAL
jgi:hypothetical protein